MNQVKRHWRLDILYPALVEDLLLIRSDHSEGGRKRILSYFGSVLPFFFFGGVGYELLHGCI